MQDIRTIHQGRRDWLATTAFTSLAYALGIPSARSADDRQVTALNRFPRMMQDWLVDRVREVEAAADARRSALKTQAEAEAYVRDVKARIRRCMGPLPERTPLNAKVTSVKERAGYRLENVVFESRPGFLVSANLSVPTTSSKPCPAVLGVCGHSLNGKAADAYQSFAQGLARLGYVVLIIDPVGQGERFQYLKEEPGKGLMSRYNGGTSEHIRMGNQLGLAGEFLGTWFAWDGIRGVDYLLTRKEVDPQRIGVTGNSGGGTQTTWLCGLEERFAMAAPACFVTTFRRNAENELPADTEQCPPGALAEGLDHSDFLAAHAPKPLIILAQEKDYFDARGSQVAYQRLKHLYTLLGKPENVKLHIGPDPHGYSQPNREAMYAFFNSVTQVSDAKTEPELVIEQEAELLAAPKGQVSELGSRTVMSFTGEFAALRKPDTNQPLAARIRKALNLPAEVTAAPDYRILRSVGARGYPAKSYCTYAVETEPGIHALLTRLSEEALTSRLPASESAVLYVSHRSADRELREDAWLRALLEKETGTAVFAMDVRGIGESQPDTCGKDQFLRLYGSDYFYAAHGEMLGRPVLGMRAFDVLSVLKLLRETGHKTVHVIARGWGTLPASIAAALCSEVQKITLKNALTSWLEVANEDHYELPYALTPFGVLKHFDLPEVYSALKDKALTQSEPWGPKDGMGA